MFTRPSLTLNSSWCGVVPSSNALHCRGGASPADSSASETRYFWLFHVLLARKTPELGSFNGELGSLPAVAAGTCRGNRQQGRPRPDGLRRLGVRGPTSTAATGATSLRQAKPSQGREL